MPQSAEEVLPRLDEPQPVIKNPTVAVFHSLQLGLPGVRGLDLGSFLMKRVLLGIKSTHPHLQSMITLSPMPGFRRWVKDERALANSVSIAAAFERLEPTQRSELLSATGASDPALALSGMLKRPNW